MSGSSQLRAAAWTSASRALLPSPGLGVVKRATIEHLVADVKVSEGRVVSWRKVLERKCGKGYADRVQKNTKPTIAKTLDIKRRPAGELEVPAEPTRIVSRKRKVA